MKKSKKKEIMFGDVWFDEMQLSGFKNMKDITKWVRGDSYQKLIVKKDIIIVICKDHIGFWVRR